MLGASSKPCQTLLYHPKAGGRSLSRVLGDSVIFITHHSTLLALVCRVEYSCHSFNPDRVVRITN